MKESNFLLTGAPGIGKTTVITRLASLLGDKAAGFYTAEIRSGGRRRGFSIVSLKSGTSAPLADVNFSSPFQVGRYGVEPDNLLPFVEEINRELEQPEEKKCLLVDEIGKMELFSNEFQQAIQAAVDSPLPLVATVMQKPEPFCDRLKSRPQNRVLEVTKSNRDELPGLLFRRVSRLLGDSFSNKG